MGRLSAYECWKQSIGLTKTDYKKLLIENGHLEYSECSRAGVANFCSGEDIKPVQLTTKVNVFNGEVAGMCKECRKANVGSFKIIKVKNEDKNN